MPKHSDNKYFKKKMVEVLVSNKNIFIVDYKNAKVKKTNRGVEDKDFLPPSLSEEYNGLRNNINQK